MGVSFQSAMNCPPRQLGAVASPRFKSPFPSLYQASRISLPATPSTPAIAYGIQRNWQQAGPRGGLPALITSLAPLIERLKKVAYKATTGGKFQEAQTQFLFILHSIPLLVLNTRQEVNEAKELLVLCREYLNGIRIELQRKRVQVEKGDPVRIAELAAYFTHCNLQPLHLMLALRGAMTWAYKSKNYNTSSSFARRLLELNPKQDIATQARKIVRFAEQNPRDEKPLKYDERNPFVVCSISLTPIYRGSAKVACPFCGSSFMPEHAGKVCPTCQVAKVGADASGLKLIAPTR
eukprot:TRINITY_DN1125_c0_g1_i5.p3 TRINITY_DN1125_c0_g1~~TRINITY_DN1125_c0_g1_i5.p3  ORF type:complete len:301 (+),score=93.05 TRINITY_DN1125_c0_g1_i5:26-904(+)